MWTPIRTAIRVAGKAVAYVVTAISLIFATAVAAVLLVYLLSLLGQ